ncbi:MAG: hypothetical protein WD737_14770, partial [Gemmatimonadota bacterium]
MENQIRILSAAEVRTCVDMPSAIRAVAEAFAALSQGRARSPIRMSLSTPDGKVLLMPAYVDSTQSLAAKLVTVFPENLKRGLPLINGVVLVLDAETGRLQALLDGTYLTAVRTGAASGAATDLLARTDARVLTIFGSGGQSRPQIEAVRAVRQIEEVRIVSKTGVSATQLAEELAGVEVRVMTDPAEAVSGAHVVCTATTSFTPVFPADAVDPGTHVNGIGSYTAEMQEVPAEFVRIARVVVDSRDAALEEAGDLVIPIREGIIGADHISADLGEIVAGSAPARTGDDEITFFKSVGNAVQDVAVASLVLEAAES